MSSSGGGSGGDGGGSAGFHHNININEHGGHGYGVEETMVKKTGRPRKYAPDGSMSPSAAARAAKLTPVNAATAVSLNGSFEPPHPGALPITAAPVSSVLMEDGFGPVKKVSGRPPGSTNRKQKIESFGSGGSAFTPHLIMVQPGEDVLNKIMALSQNGPRAVCIMSGI